MLPSNKKLHYLLWLCVHLTTMIRLKILRLIYVVLQLPGIKYVIIR